jgi:U6 snRNA-associated Sm-like protein LSm6
MSTSKVTPGDFLKQTVGKDVRVRLNNGNDFVGKLSCLDGFLNIAMEKTTEYNQGEQLQSYGDAFLRGNNIVYITEL